MASRLPPPRRIVTANRPLPAALHAAAAAEPAVLVAVDDLAQEPELGGGSARATVFTHEHVPTSNTGMDTTAHAPPGGGLVLPRGANIRYNDLGPGQRVPMHRTATTDYNVVLAGEFVLVTPAEPAEEASAVRRTQETVCRPGDVIVQRGTLHAWENRTDAWARSIVVMLGAEPTQTAIEGSDDVKMLPDWFGGE